MASDSIVVAKATAVITEGSPIAVRMAATADRIIVADRTIAAALVANWTIAADTAEEGTVVRPERGLQRRPKMGSSDRSSIPA